MAESGRTITIEGWEEHAVLQRSPETGCIPMSYEVLLRHAGIGSIDFGGFQETFDLDKDLKPGQSKRNNLRSVADAIETAYPDVKLEVENFPREDGQEKIDRIRELLERGEMPLVSVPVKFEGKVAAHVVPAVRIDADGLDVYWGTHVGGKPEIVRTTLKDLVELHKMLDGCHDIASLGTAKQ